MDVFSIYLEREFKVIIPMRKGRLPDPVLATALKELEQLGFTFSRSLIEHLQTWKQREFVPWFENLVEQLRQIIGDNEPYKPMYPGFPDQVMNIQKSQLYLNALLHYWTHQLPEGKPAPRIMLLDQVSLKVIDLGSEQEFEQIGVQLLNSRTSLSPTSREHLRWFASVYQSVVSLIPERIPNKENAAIFLAALYSAGRASADLIRPHISTATDVLRLITALSDGDVSLADNTRFRSMKREERRMLLRLLEELPSPLEDFFRYPKRWIRVGERLHPGEYRSRFPRTAEAFDRLRSGDKPETFYHQVEQAFAAKDNSLLLEILSKRPGEFARRMERMLRSGVEADMLVRNLMKHGEEVSTPVLLSLISHFSSRHELRPRRQFFPKGGTAHLFVKEEELAPLEKTVIDSVVDAAKQLLRDRFSKLPPLGKVYVDEQLANYPVPWGSRSASKSLLSLPRRSRIPIRGGETIRFFLWWKEGEVNGKHTGQVDIDLSSVLYDENWEYLSHTSYTNLRSEAYQAAHSGDIVTAPEGAAEYIDLHLPSVKQYGARYVVMLLNSFTYHKFQQLPECVAGWMMRQVPQSGEIFEPSTVFHKMDITSNSSICLPVIVDLHREEIIWCDLALKSWPNEYINNVESSKFSVSLIGRAMMELKRPDLFTLFELHAEARGERTYDSKDADTVFSADWSKGLTEERTCTEILTPLDQDRITAEFM